MIIAENRVWQYCGHVWYVRVRTIRSSSHITLKGDQNMHAWPAWSAGPLAASKDVTASAAILGSMYRMIAAGDAAGTGETWQWQ